MSKPDLKQRRIAWKMNEKDAWKVQASFGYALIILVIGFPVWDYTTKVYRASLPYDEIESLDDPKISQSILLISQDAKNDHLIGPKLQAVFAKSQLLKINFRSRVRTEEEEDNFFSFTSLKELDQSLITSNSLKNGNEIVIFETSPLLFGPKDQRVLAIGSGRVLYYKSGCDPDLLAQAIKGVLGLEKIDNIGTAIESPSRDTNPSWTLRRPVAAPAFDVLFSLMVPEPDYFKPTWDIENSVKIYLDPILEKINDLVDVSVKSQILYLSTLTLKPKPKGDYFYVTQDDLGKSLYS